MLKILDLHVKVKEKEILKGINLEVKKGEKHVILGPNASGKSSLVYSIIGFPEYRITKGKIYFLGKDITSFSIEERVKFGIGISFQTPPSIEITFSSLINRIKKIPLDIPEFLKDRKLNVDFSGGEKKLAEIIQLLALDPKLIIFDEIEANLDIENFDRVMELINTNFKNKTLIFITHQEKLLEYIKPDYVEILINGKIMCKQKNWRKVLDTIKTYGYKKCFYECKKRK